MIHKIVLIEMYLAESDQTPILIKLFPKASPPCPEFKGNVLTVETRGFWRMADVSPRNQGFHYNQNAETYMLVGEALGKGMLKLLKTNK